LWATIEPAYTEAVTAALVDAMIDTARRCRSRRSRLTVAARDDEGRDSMAPQDPMEEVVTMIIGLRDLNTGRDASTATSAKRCRSVNGA
jgi:hypothetical protein